MNMAGAMVQSRAGAPQGASRDARVKDDGAAGGAARGDDDSFRDVMSDVADRAEAKRGDGASAQGAGARTSARAGVAQGATGEPNDSAAAEVNTASDDATGEMQIGPSLLEQVALVLAPAPSVPAAAATTGEAALLSGASRSERSVLSASWQLLSSLAAAGEGAAEAGAAMPTDGATAAMAALVDGSEDATFPALTAQTAIPTSDAEEVASFPAIKVTVTGEETHFAPVKSGEETLSRLLANPSADAVTVLAEAKAAAAPREATSSSAKDGAALQLAATGEPAPLVAAGDAASSRRGGDEPRGDGRPAEGQARTTAAEQQSARLASAASDFQASASDVGTGIADAAAPAAQIARRIAAELANPASRPAVVSSGSDGAVKVLHLQLEPANLGGVTVTLALKDDVITVHLEASRQETALAIEKDRAELSNALKSAGYVVDNISAQPSDGMRSSSQFQPQAVTNDGQMSSSFQSQGNAQQGLAQSGRGNQGDGGRQGPGRGSMPPGINESRGEGSRASGGALYV